MNVFQQTKGRLQQAFNKVKEDPGHYALMALLGIACVASMMVVSQEKEEHREDNDRQRDDLSAARREAMRLREENEKLNDEIDEVNRNNSALQDELEKR